MSSPLFVSYVHPQVFSFLFHERTVCFMLFQRTYRPGLKRKGAVDARKPSVAPGRRKDLSRDKDRRRTVKKRKKMTNKNSGRLPSLFLQKVLSQSCFLLSSFHPTIRPFPFSNLFYPSSRVVFYIATAGSLSCVQADTLMPGLPFTPACRKSSEDQSTQKVHAVETAASASSSQLPLPLPPNTNTKQRKYFTRSESCQSPLLACHSSAQRRSRRGISSPFSALEPSASAFHDQYSPRRISAYEA